MKDKLRKLIPILAILVGIGILVYPSVSEYVNRQHATQTVVSYDDSVEKADAARLDALLEEAREYNRMLASITGFEKPPVDSNGDPITPDSYYRLLNLNGDGMMGYITVPKLNITAAILHGTDEPALQSGIGHLENTSLPVGGESSHSVLSGHRGLPTAELFTDLDRLVIGDVFYIKVLKKTFCYTVDRILTVMPDETDELAIVQGKDYCTLVTCTPYGINSHRLLVRGVRTPFEETGRIPVYENVNMDSFWTSLPAQYRHMLYGAAAIIAFLIIYLIVLAVRRRSEKRRNSEDDTDR